MRGKLARTAASITATRGAWRSAVISAQMEDDRRCAWTASRPARPMAWPNSRGEPSALIQPIRGVSADMAQKVLHPVIGRVVDLFGGSAVDGDVAVLHEDQTRADLPGE